MELGPIGCICIAVAIFFAIVGLVIFVLKITEKYKKMRDIAKFPIQIAPRVRAPSRDDPDSLKYRGHRYERHRIRSNPHVRRYQDNLS